jgi:hypothetical protein
MATNKTVLSVALSGRVTASVADPYAGHGPLENRDGRRTIRTSARPVKGKISESVFYLFAPIRGRKRERKMTIKIDREDAKSTQEGTENISSRRLFFRPLRVFVLRLVFVSGVTFVGGVQAAAPARSA